MSGAADVAPVASSHGRDGLGHGAIWVTIASGVFVLSGYVINVVLGRLLGPADYGLFGVTIGLLTLINSLQVSALPQAVARFTARRPSEAGDLLRLGALLQLGSGLVLGLVLFYLAEPLANLFGDPALVAPLQVAASALPAYAVFSLFLSFNGGRGRYVRQALMLAVYAVVKATASITLGLALHLVGAVLGYVVAPLLGLVAVGRGLLAIRTGRIPPAMSVLAYATPLLLIAMLTIVLLNLDLLFVKALVPDAAQAGYYTAAQALARVTYFLLTGFAIIVLPATARAAEVSSEAARGVVQQSVRLGVLAVAPLTALLMGAGEELVQLLYTPAYTPAVASLFLLGPAMAGFALSTLLASLLSGAGRPYLAVGALAGGTATSVLANLVLVPALGAPGAAIGTLAGAAVALVGGTAAAMRHFRMALPLPSIVRAVVASVGLAVGAHFLDGWVATLLGVPLLALAYVAALVVLREPGPDDWHRLRALFPGRVSRRETF